MTFDKFVGEVQHRAGLNSMGDAVRVIRCTLGVLSQRLAGGEAKDLASQLPSEIGYYLLHSEAGRGRRFSVGEFLDRVSFCEGIGKPKAVFHVRAVLEVLREAVSAGEFEDILAQLPGKYEPLFTAACRGALDLKHGKKPKPATARSPRTAVAARGSRRPLKSKETETAPRSARIAKRATGARHLGR
jgi:uncharacterized protein (DUF2267 family)